MRHDNRTEFLNEIIDLATEQLEHLRKEINFYKASIYKDELWSKTTDRINGLKLIFDLFDNHDYQDIFENFSDEINYFSPVPGEDFLVSAAIRVASQCQTQLEIIKSKMLYKKFESNDFTRRVRSARRSLAKLCSEESSSKSFFSNL